MCPPSLPLRSAYVALEGRDMSSLIAGQWRRRLSRDEGQDLLEYALLVALIVVVAVGAVTTVGSTIKTVFWDVIAASATSI